MRLGITKNQGCLEKKSRLGIAKNQSCLGTIEESYNKNQGCQKKLNKGMTKIKVAKKNWR